MVIWMTDNSDNDINGDDVGDHDDGEYGDDNDLDLVISTLAAISNKERMHKNVSETSILTFSW